LWNWWFAVMRLFFRARRKCLMIRFRFFARW
jgi:hypothetical protein